MSYLFKIIIYLWQKLLKEVNEVPCADLDKLGNFTIHFLF